MSVSEGDVALLDDFPMSTMTRAAEPVRTDFERREPLEAMDHTFRCGIYDRPLLKTWSTDRITLPGDAAHAVTPQLGQGANQAVEDAITLAVLLQDAQAADIPMRLRRYEDRRIERTRQVHDGSREAAALYRSTELLPGQQPNGSSLSTTDCNSTPTTPNASQMTPLSAL